MAHGKYLHEVLAEAQPEDIAYYIALKQLEHKEEGNTRRRQEARRKTKGQ